MHPDRIAVIQERLKVLCPTLCDVDDESHLHVGHVGAKSGGGHFRLRIISQKFDGLRLIERHRLVYDALGELMLRDIHALSIHAFSPQEVS